MVKPQQPELRRSDRGATSDDATKGRLSAPSVPGVGGEAGPIPAENAPGHHPPQEQDKPSGRDFVAKMHALAQADAAGDDGVDAQGRPVGPPTDRSEEVFDLTDVAADEVHTGSEGPQHRISRAGDRLAGLAGKPFALAGGALSAIRRRLPGD